MPNLQFTDLPPDDAAAYWRARLASGAIDAEERASFELWMTTAENRAAFDALGDALKAADEIEVDLLEEAFTTELHEAAARAADAQGFWRRRGAIAASIAVVALGGFGAYVTLAPERASTIAYETGVGERRTIKLPDDSIVELNTDTALRVAQSRERRDVTLVRGEAVFNVERDPDRPFHVAAANATITVTGTVFGVRDFGGASSVYVVSGAVDVAGRRSGDDTLLAGDSIIVGGDGVSGSPSRFDPGDFLAWRHGKARFSEASLGHVMAELNRYFPKPVVAGDDTTASLPISGEFDIKDQPTALAAVSRIHSLEIVEEADRFVLRRKS